MNKALIEWFIISGNITECEHQGRLLEPKIVQHDIKSKILNILQKYSIFYEYDEIRNLYVIYGYRQCSKEIDVENAEHYNWKTVYDGWHLLKSDELSVIAEKMLANTYEDMHYHYKARQFFYVLSGEAEIYGPKKNAICYNVGKIQMVRKYDKNGNRQTYFMRV